MMSCIYSGGRGGGGVQKLYHNLFSTFLIQSVEQVIESMRRRVLENFPSQLSFGDEGINPRI